MSIVFPPPSCHSICPLRVDPFQSSYAASVICSASIPLACVLHSPVGHAMDESFGIRGCVIFGLDEHALGFSFLSLGLQESATGQVRAEILAVFVDGFVVERSSVGRVSFPSAVHAGLQQQQRQRIVFRAFRRCSFHSNQRFVLLS